jgi:N-acetyl-gamma-glutamylphosphate reductase
VYRLRVTPNDNASLLTIQVLADRDGKCGAAQVVHMMNVMAGFEETLGLEYGRPNS